MSFVTTGNVDSQLTDRAGLPSATMPSTSDIPFSHWQPTNEVDPDQNFSPFRDFTSRLVDSCVYYSDNDSIDEMNKFNSAALSLMHFNVRGITSSQRYNELESFVRTKPIKVIGLCETFLNIHNNNLYMFTGYHVVHKSRTGRQGGGIALLIKENLSFTERPDLSSHLPAAESLFIELPRSMSLSNKKIIIGEIYLPPAGNKASFIDQMETLLQALNSGDALCYIMGDLNIDLMTCDTVPDSLDYLNSFHRNSFYPLINRPTRLASNILLDHIFTNSHFCLRGGHFSCGVILHDLSDHCPIFHFSDLTLANCNEQVHQFSFQLINERTIFALKAKLAAIDWNELLSIADVNECYNKFLELLSDAYFASIPVITKVRKNSRKPWISNSLLISIEEKTDSTRCLLNTLALLPKRIIDHTKIA